MRLYPKVLICPFLVQSRIKNSLLVRSFILTKAEKATPSKQSSAQSPEQDASLPQDFETALAELEAVVASMESGTLALEQSLSAYRRGVALTRICQQLLAQAEQQVKVLEAGVLRPFEGAVDTE
jgi:exodeoxyribonuclease VII small subunit